MARRKHRPPRHAAVLLLAALVGMIAAAGTAGWAEAAEQFPSSPNHRGIAEFEPYRVFPENRQGNGVYLDNLLVFAAQDRTVVDVLPLPVEGRFVYYARTAQGTALLGSALKQGDGKPRVQEIADNFFHVVLTLGGVVYKKFYRIVDDKILDLLPSSKTADGPVAGPGGVVFFHVASTIREGQDGQTMNGYGLGLHLALPEDERPRHLNYLVINSRPSVAIKWLDETRIELSLGEGRSEIISISQFQ